MTRVCCAERVLQLCPVSVRKQASIESQPTLRMMSGLTNKAQGGGAHQLSVCQASVYAAQSSYSKTRKEQRPKREDAATRRRNQGQAAYDGRLVAMRARKVATKLARVSDLGLEAGLKCYEANFDDGSFQQLSATEVKRRLMPAGTEMAVAGD
eukprot:1144077-Pelagomonas_calceolata.AAC.13